MQPSTAPSAANVLVSEKGCWLSSILVGDALNLAVMERAWPASHELTVRLVKRFKANSADIENFI